MALFWVTLFLFYSLLSRYQISSVIKTDNIIGRQSFQRETSGGKHQLSCEEAATQRQNLKGLTLSTNFRLDKHLREISDTPGTNTIKHCFIDKETENKLLTFQNAADQTRLSSYQEF